MPLHRDARGKKLEIGDRVAVMATVTGLYDGNLITVRYEHDPERMDQEVPAERVEKRKRRKT